MKYLTYDTMINYNGIKLNYTVSLVVEAVVAAVTQVPKCCGFESRT